MIPNFEEFDRALREQKGKRCTFIGKKCPGDQCPAWWKTQWQKTSTDGTSVRLVEGCSFRLQQFYFQMILDEHGKMMESSLEAHVQQSKAVQAFGETVHNGLVQLGTSVTKHLEKANGLPTRQTSPRELRSAEASSSEADGDCSASAPAGIHGPGPD